MQSCGRPVYSWYLQLESNRRRMPVEEEEVEYFTFDSSGVRNVSPAQKICCFAEEAHAS